MQWPKETGHKKHTLADKALHRNLTFVEHKPH